MKDLGLWTRSQAGDLKRSALESFLLPKQ